MNRWLALLLAVVLGAIGAYVGLLFAGGALVGILWLYVFGDDTWPAGWETAVGAVLIAGGLALWAWLAWLIWSRLTRPA